MSTIKKLKIQGVRSYSHLKPGTIEFFKPLTIIVGANGSGKTTIIEALKFITTGEQPPLSEKGRSFVHDPKITGIPVVKGKIMLGFQTADAKTFVATRAFQLTQKSKQKQEYKQIDSVLRTKNELGEEKAVSHRCTDMDKQVPLLMGVSRAVLENVIFCHQEDSNWPLSDSRSLKKKFDDIFAATRWTQAQDEIYKIRRQKASEVRKMEAELGVLEANLQEAKKVKVSVGDLKSKIKANSVIKVKFEGERVKYINKLEKLQEVDLKLRGLQSACEAKQEHMKILVKEKDEAFKEVEQEFEDSDEKLEEERDKIRQDIKQYGAQRDQLNKEYYRYEKIKGELEQRLKGIVQRLAQAKVAEESYRRDKKTCEDLSLRCANKYKFSGINLSGSMNIDTFQAVRKKLQEAIRTREDQIRNHKGEAKRADEDFELRIERLNKEVNTIEAELSLKKNQKSKIVARMEQIEKDRRRTKEELASCSDARINEKIEKTEAHLENLKKDENPAAIEKSIGDILKKLEYNRSELEVLKIQQQSISDQNDMRKTIRSRCLREKELRSKIEEKLFPQESELMSLLGISNMNPSTLDRDFSTSLQIANEKLRNDDDTLLKLEQKSSSIAGELDSCRRQLKKTRADIELERKCFEHQGIDIASKPLDRQIKEYEDYLDVTTRSLMLLEPMKELLTLFKRQANRDSDKKCPLCTRCMDQRELDNFLRNLEKLHKKTVSTEKKKKLIRQSEKYKEQLARRRKLTDNWMNLKSMQKQEPALRQKVRELEDKRKAYTESKTAFYKERKAKLEHKDKLEFLRNLVSEITYLHKQATEEKRAIDEEKSKLSSEFDENQFAEIEIDIKRIQAETSNKNKELMALQRRQSKYVSQTRELQSTLNELRRKQSQYHRHHVKLENLEKEKNIKQRSITEIEDTVSRCKEQIRPLQTKIENLREQRNKEHQHHARNEKILLDGRISVTQDLNALMDKVNSLKRLESSFDREKTRALRVQHQETLEKTQVKKRQMESALKLKDETVAYTEKKRRVEKQINASLYYRGKVAEVMRVGAEIVKMKEQLNQHGGHNIVQSTKQVRERIQQKQSKIDKIEGKIMAQNQQIKQFTQELETPRLKNIEDRHRKLLIETHVTRLAIKDLEIYSKALEKALMEFHSAKMGEINEVLRDYWQSTYCGHDIEEIQIQSNHTLEVKGRRQYNYRVVMKQRDTELDMRGRCSAGQKVLASLLIRLALAETFCTRCGVLALDEPTTNLDQANIRKFARALNQIIEKRAKQENFQLIVITHDEEFVDMLGQRDHCDYYYRVYKDDEQCSRIKRQPL